MKTKKTAVKKTAKKKVVSNNIIKSLRLSKKMTQNEFSNILGISQGQLCKLENGNQEINIKVAKTLVKKFKIPAEKIIKSNLSL